jgi:uncharacterized surface protein with fasciclin (FAS1) repeats
VILQLLGGDSHTSLRTSSEKTDGNLQKGLGVSGGETVADIVHTAIAAGSFRTLVTAIRAAGLVETQRGTSATVIKADIITDNGLIHVIDTVLLPT